MCNINKHIRPWTLLLALKQTLAFFFLMPKEIKLDIKIMFCVTHQVLNLRSVKAAFRMNKPRG